MHAFSYALPGIVVILGAYMMFAFGGMQVNPPTVSGLAFILLGIRQLLPSALPDGSQQRQPPQEQWQQGSRMDR